MFYTEPYPVQRGRGTFYVDRYPIQRGRGLGGIFASLFRKIIPFGKSFAKTALTTGKDFIKSDVGKDIINDTIASAAKAASNVLIDSNPEEARKEMIKSLKRSKNKTTDVVKRIAKDKLEKVLTGGGRISKSGKRVKRSVIKRNLTLLDF
jgi:hypothetical protein